jgi:hypothetical protein
VTGAVHWVRTPNALSMERMDEGRAPSRVTDAVYRPAPCAEVPRLL